MTEFEQMDESERLQFTEFKRNLNRQAAQAQVGKIEYELTDASVDKNILKRVCQDANALKLGAICTLPCYVRTCEMLLGKDPQTSLIACISLPHGGDTTEIKVKAIKDAVKNGVDEVEVTAPIAYVKDANWGYVKRELKKLKGAAKKCGLRINIESSLLTPQEITKLCTVAADCGITSLRVSSDSYGIPDAEVVTRIKAAVKDKCTVKAVGITGLADMNVAFDMGAGIVGSKNAADLARLIFQTV